VLDQAMIVEAGAPENFIWAGSDDLPSIFAN
jgi:hypothetical protein